MSNLKITKVSELLKNTFQKFNDEDTLGLAASLAYYTIFSLPPLIIIIIHASGIFSQQQQVQGEIYGQLGAFIGAKGVQQLKDTISNEGFLRHNTINTIISLIALFFTSTSLFTTIQGSLNFIFRVKAKPKRSFLKLFTDRAVSFGMILLLAIILLVTLLLETALKFFSRVLDSALPQLGALLMHTITHAVVFLLIALVFTMVFKYLPDAKVRWKDTIIGALVTTMLFTLGKIVIGYYISKSHLGSIYDAAGSILVLLVWVYYSSVIFFLGAQFTYVYARFYGLHIRPASYAVRIIQQEIEIDEEAPGH